MRVLFVQIAREACPEYDVHRTFAENAPVDRIEAFFVWQRHTVRPSADKGAMLPNGEQNLFLDFGRDLEVPSRPPRVGRAIQMLRRSPASLGALARHVRRTKPDVVYTSQQTFDVHLAKLICAAAGVPHVLHVHYPVGPWLGRGMVGLIKRTPRLLAVSDFIRDQAIRAGVPPASIVTQRNTIPVERFSGARGGHRIRDEFGWSHDTPLVVAVGRLDPSKGHRLLLQAFAEVVRELPSARLLVCGRTFMRERYDLELEQLANGLGLAAHVVFAGARADVPAIMAEADLFALPTENEACGLVFLEAMAAGLPAVAIRSGGVPELVVDGETGLLSDPGDAEQLARNMLRILEDGSVGDRMGKSGRSRVFAEFSPKHVAETWTTTVEELVRRGRT